MRRRGYWISAILLFVDLLLFPVGGGIVGLSAVLYAAGLGEWIARIRYNAVRCDSQTSVQQKKLNTCFEKVKERIDQEGRFFPKGVKIYLIPGAEMNAYCFGRKSIGVTEGSLNLDEKMVEAMIAHEIGHLIAGDTVLNMIMMVNCMGILALFMICQVTALSVVYILFVILCLIGICHFSFMSCFVTNKIAGGLKWILRTMKMAVLQICRLAIALLGRRSEFKADGYAASLGYAFYLKNFLERFAPDVDFQNQNLFDVLYNTHPSTLSRVQRLTEKYR